MQRGFLTAIVGALILVGLNHAEAPVNAQPATPDALTFFKNYFITGDYVVAGVGLQSKGVNGLATGDITISGVPAGADIQAAFLYWQVVTTDTLGPASGSAGARFNGHPLENPNGPLAKVLGDYGTAPCWSSGGGTGSSGGTKQTYTYRADVLRFLDVDESPTSANYGKYIVNGAHAVTLPDSGSGNGIPIALGASLVVVYRDTTKPLSAVVIYDGSYTINNSALSLSQTIKGFYQAASSPRAKITYIVGSGQSNKRENLDINGSLVLNPFSSSAGSSWDNLTFPVTGLTTTSSQFTTTVDTANLKGSDCLTWGAIVFKTDVMDTDEDGLLDVWETNTGSLVDPNGRPLPALGNMGASPTRKDLFVEIGYTTTNGLDLSYDTWNSTTRLVVPTLKPAHTHRPSPEALQMMADAFKTAPTPITVHFDIGNVDADPGYASGVAAGYILPGYLARGGESLDERRTQCVRDAGSPPWMCQFSGNPGTLGWKTGFRYVRDEVLGSAPAPTADQNDVCETPSSPYYGQDGPGQPCERRFDRNRKDTFHYAFFAHALGLPRAQMPCVSSAGDPTGVDPDTLLCRTGDVENPEFRIPKTTSGVGDFPGGDVLITLGGFQDIDGKPTGTSFMQASTLMHELGHNFARRHSGEASTLAVPNPNCKPTYLSVMNYLYQLRGLLDDSGKPHLDYSRAVGFNLNEQGLLDTVPASSPYRLGWYAPLDTSYLAGRASPAKSHCDGSALLPTDLPMVRIDARRANDPFSIDWNADGVLLSSSLFTLDINFNGRSTVFAGSGGGEILSGSEDWTNLKLNQVGSRRSVGGFYTDDMGILRFGAVSLDMGRVDFGRVDFGRVDFGRVDFGRVDFGRVDFGAGDLGLGDFGRVDFGRVDFGRVDFGRVDFGRVDFGRVDFGAGDLGQGDFGGGDIFQGDPNNIGGELDAETAGDLARTPPNEFTACVIGIGGCTAATGSAHDVKTTFKAPNVGGVFKFIVYRVAGDTLLPGATWIKAGETNAVSGQVDYTVVDTAQPELEDGKSYTYFAIAEYADGIRSDVSNLVTITPAVNDAPTVSNIPDQTIYANTSAGPITFTIGDERLANVTLSGSSSNTTLVPTANIVFGGTGATRSVTVTPITNLTGTATITVTVTDGSGRTGTDTFVLTVKPLVYDFTGFLSPLQAAGTLAAPTDSGVVNFGSAVPLKWTLYRGGVMITDLGSLAELKAVPGTGSGTTCTPAAGAPTLYLLNPGTLQPTGGSTYRFSTDHFTFNWDTTGTSATNCYTISLTLNDGTTPKVTIIRFK